MGTHTFATMQVTALTFEEIKSRLLAAGYDHAIHDNPDGGTIIDMHGIGLEVENPDNALPQFALTAEDLQIHRSMAENTDEVTVRSDQLTDLVDLASAALAALSSISYE